MSDKVNFYAEYTLSESIFFHFEWLLYSVEDPILINYLHSYRSRVNLHEMKYKQRHPGFELVLPIPLATTITITLCAIQNTECLSV